MLRGVRIIALLILWLVPGTILYTALTSAWAPVWMHWGVPTMLPSFADLRVITTGIKTVQEGGDPFLGNPSDIGQRPTNYPRIWIYSFAALGINDKNLPVV